MEALPPSLFINPLSERSGQADGLFGQLGQALVRKGPVCADQPFLPLNVTRSELEKPIQSLLYLRDHIPVITPGSAPQLIVPLLEVNLLDPDRNQINNTRAVEVDKKPPLNAFMIFRMTQSMFLTFSPSGRAKSGERVVSRLISTYWRLLVTVERNDWFELADDLKQLKELKRKHPALVASGCSKISAKFAVQPHIPPSTYILSQVDGKIGPRVRPPSVGSRSVKSKSMLDKFMPVMRAQARAKRIDRSPSNEQSGSPVKLTSHFNDLALAPFTNREILASTSTGSFRLPPVSDLLRLGDYPVYD